MPAGVGPNRGLIDDGVAALLVLNHARRRLVARVFGLEELSRTSRS